MLASRRVRADCRTCWRSRTRRDGPSPRERSVPRYSPDHRRPSCQENPRRSRASGAKSQSPHFHRARRRKASLLRSRDRPRKPQARQASAVPSLYPGSGYLAVKLGACTHGVEQRPVALLDLETLRKWWPDLQTQRSHDAIVPVVALQDDPLEIHQRLAAAFLQPSSGGLALRRLQIGKHAAGRLVERSQHCQNMLCITPEASQECNLRTVVESVWFDDGRKRAF